MLLGSFKDPVQSVSICLHTDISNRLVVIEKSMIVGCHIHNSVVVVVVGGSKAMLSNEYVRPGRHSAHIRRRKGKNKTKQVLSRNLLFQRNCTCVKYKTGTSECSGSAAVQSKST